ncbi:biotin transporter BioY [Weeksellaceae bacterium KMM 9713]|uniref:Biotin transporter n=1 Tax=Profundicola chukchiensis TaxID=2961959 RepID=A0A9X4MZ48_9FLAO|nr:biotin transporter BioY [Profundicola chukchiensis]MDG4946282.1 biotin transporter BioY [Profundicola chukchiensis]
MYRALRISLSLLILFLFTQIQFHVPIFDIGIPITGQSFAIVLLPYIFGLREGVISILLYLLLGLVGVPVLAQGGHGVDAFLSNSGGYLIGFIFGGAFSGFISDNKVNNLKNAFLAMCIGTLIILIFGVLKLSFEIGISKAIEYGFTPFVLGGVIKVVVGAFAGWLTKKYIMTLDFNFD